tara:strand:- start:1099 stop:1587 length:489 start_codon:yes stop_codon:yes gene_type:complete
MKRVLILVFFSFVWSCSNLDFIYSDKKNITNPLYQKTQVNTLGKDIVFMKSYIPMFFGNTENEEFVLSINIKEEQTKRAVATNQAASNLRYELRFLYMLNSSEKGCVTYEKEILSTFTILPKSSGYNYGTDSSLEKKYELAVIDNFNRFISYISSTNLYNCL